jgi:hypothetical protein
LLMVAMAPPTTPANAQSVPPAALHDLAPTGQLRMVERFLRDAVLADLAQRSEVGIAGDEQHRQVGKVLGGGARHGLEPLHLAQRIREPVALVDLTAQFAPR